MRAPGQNSTRSRVGAGARELHRGRIALFLAKHNAQHDRGIGNGLVQVLSSRCGQKTSSLGRSLRPTATKARSRSPASDITTVQISAPASKSGAAIASYSQNKITDPRAKLSRE